MWVRIEIISSDREVILLPASLGTGNVETKQVVFGRKSIESMVQYTGELDAEKGDTYENPAPIRLSDKLVEQLFLPEALTYQLKMQNDSVVLGPVIGLLLGIHTQRYSPKHMKKYSDRFGIYTKIGGLIYAFSPKSVDWKKRIAYGLFFNITKAAWEFGCFPLPDVIYRRDFHSSPKLVKRLIKLTEGRLFNSYRFSKSELYDFIRRDPELSTYLPATALSQNFLQVKKFIDNIGIAILKPIDLSRGRGICIVEKADYLYKVTDYRYRYPVVSVFRDRESLENFFNLNQNLFNKYLIQEYLSLARIGNSLFDIRVVMQKGYDKTWGCTGIECRVSAGNSHLTNISRGGYALSLEEALHQAFPVNCDCEKLTCQIHEFCQKFCVYMDTLGEHFAEFGMDVAVDVDKNLWLIEANVFPSFKGFKKMDRQTYHDIRYKPILYALSLTDFANENVGKE